MRGLASVQQTSLDIAWIRGGVVCLGTRGNPCYRGILSAVGPPEALGLRARECSRCWTASQPF